MSKKKTLNQYRNSAIETIKYLNRKAKITILSVIAGCLIFSTAFTLAAGTEVYSLTIAGEKAGYITNKSIVHDAVNEIVADYAKSEEPIEVTVDTGKITYEKTKLHKEDVKALTQEELEQKIIGSEICTAKGWAVNISGSNIVAAASRSDTELILDSVKAHYTDGGSTLISADFKETVFVTEAAVQVSDMMGADEAVSYIVTGAEAPKVYTVKDGDTIWDIAAANGMSADQLQKANPGFDPNRIQIGQQLNLVAMKPFVTVITKEQVTTTEKIPYSTVYEETKSLNRGVLKVKTPGITGKKEVTSEITKENGTVIAANVIKSTVISEPKNEVALKGTKTAALVAANRGSGSIGRIVSFAASGSEIVSYAKQFIGVPYVHGGTTPKGFDCSGFTQYVMRHFGGSIPRTTSGQYGSGTRISKSELRPGDLVFFKPSSASTRISHVGIYTGGGKFIHSPQPGQSVEISDLSSNYNISHYYGAVRVTE